MSEGKYEPPRETKEDIAHAAGRGFAGAIPFAGQSAIEIFSTIVTPPIERRKDAWRVRVGKAIEELEGFRAGIVEELQNNEAFVDTLMQASTVAMRTSQVEKLEALRNAIQNAALAEPDDSLRPMFLQLVDRFTPMHLELLALLDDPEKWIAERDLTTTPNKPKTLGDVVYCIYRELEREWDEVLWERVCKDLHESGLLIASSLRQDVGRFPYFPDTERTQQTGYWFADELPGDSVVAYSGSPTAYRHWTTDMGRKFLHFIKSPFSK